MSLPFAKQLNAVSPSRARDLEQCLLRVAFKQHAPKSAAQSDPQIIGEAVHATLAKIVKSGSVTDANAPEIAEQLFWNELDERAPGREVRRARPAAARARKLIAHLQALLAQAGPDATTLCETPLHACDGALYGVVDLIIDSKRLHAVVDYKAGPVTDDTAAVSGDYATQLRLYAVLEHERSGRWPTRGTLIRFGGAPVEIELDPADCEDAARHALTLRDGYNALTDNVPSASPGVQTCDWCSFAPVCPRFWEVVSPGWEGRGAVRGTVQWAQPSAGGGLTLALSHSHGTHAGDLVVRRLGDEDLSVPATGAELAICGLHEDSDGRLVADRFTRWTELAHVDPDAMPAGR